jgi:hypothetical protein
MADSQGIVANLRPSFAEKGVFPCYSTPWGDAYVGDSKELLAALPDESVALVLTSPPFALRRKKNYGNVDAERYVEWFRPFAKLVELGCLVILLDRYTTMNCS